MKVNELNVQNQQKIAWPSQLTVARAYLDQLARSQALSSEWIADLNKIIVHTQKSHLGKKNLAKLHEMAASIETSASDAKNLEDSKRLHALALILESPTA